MAASIFSMKAASKNVLNMKIDEYYDIGKIEKDPDSSCHLWKGRFTRIKGKCTSRYPIETFYYVVSDGKGGNRRVKKEHYVHIMIFFPEIWPNSCQERIRHVAHLSQRNLCEPRAPFKRAPHHKQSPLQLLCVRRRTLPWPSVLP